MSAAHSHRHHSHGQLHSHGDSPSPATGAFTLAIALNLGFVIVETVFGLLANSLTLIADAGHNFGDVLGLGLAWGAGVLTLRGPTRRHTYGFGATSILASLANAAILLITVGAIAWEAIRRLFEPAIPDTGTVIWVAAVGIAVNGGSALLFLHGRGRDLNIRAAFAHLAADAGIAAGVVVAALAIRLTGWVWLDPATSLVIVGVITWGTWDLLRRSVDLTLDAVPHDVEIDAVEAYLASVPGVTQVHDLHIWAMSTTETALTAHLVRPGAPVDDGLMAQVSHELQERFGIRHATIQTEHDAAACRLADPDVV